MTPNDFLDFRGKAVLITGAATGIGRAMAVGFASRGARVAIGDINEEAARETLDHLRVDEPPWRIVAVFETDLDQHHFGTKRSRIGHAGQGCDSAARGLAPALGPGSNPVVPTNQIKGLRLSLVAFSSR